MRIIHWTLSSNVRSQSVFQYVYVVLGRAPRARWGSPAHPLQPLQKASTHPPAGWLCLNSSGSLLKAEFPLHDAQYSTGYP